jgi:hypothetical protein
MLLMKSPFGLLLWKVLQHGLEWRPRWPRLGGKLLHCIVARILLYCDAESDGWTDERLVIKVDWVLKCFVSVMSTIFRQPPLFCHWHENGWHVNVSTFCDRKLSLTHALRAEWRESFPMIKVFITTVAFSVDMNTQRQKSHNSFSADTLHGNRGCPSIQSTSSKTPS